MFTFKSLKHLVGNNEVHRRPVCAYSFDGYKMSTKQAVKESQNTLSKNKNLITCPSPLSNLELSLFAEKFFSATKELRETSSKLFCSQIHTVRMVFLGFILRW